MAKGAPTKQVPFCESNKCILFLFLFVAAAMATVICVTFLDPNVRTRYEDRPPWWERTIIYQIYPRSFQDSDGDGVGDLQGRFMYCHPSVVSEFL